MYQTFKRISVWLHVSIVIIIVIIVIIEHLYSAPSRYLLRGALCAGYDVKYRYERIFSVNTLDIAPLA